MSHEGKKIQGDKYILTIDTGSGPKAVVCETSGGIDGTQGEIDADSACGQDSIPDGKLKANTSLELWAVTDPTDNELSAGELYNLWRTGAMNLPMTFGPPSPEPGEISFTGTGFIKDCSVGAAVGDLVKVTASIVWHAVPVETIEPTPATGTAVLSTGRVVKTIAVTAGGTGYTTAPTVTFTGGGGTGATATATLTGDAVTSITVTAQGDSYTSAPTIGFTGGSGSGATATATISTGKVVKSVTVTEDGKNYATAPTVSFSGGGGTGAAATATIAGGVVTAVNMSNTGDNYTTAPAVVFTT